MATRISAEWTRWCSYLTKPCGLSLWFDRRQRECRAAKLRAPRGRGRQLSWSGLLPLFQLEAIELVQERVRGRPHRAACAGWLRGRRGPHRRHRAAAVVQRERGDRPAGLRCDIDGRLLRSLSADVPHRFDNAQDVYLSAPWSRQTRLHVTGAPGRGVGRMATGRRLAHALLPGIVSHRGDHAHDQGSRRDRALASRGGPIGASRFIVAEIEIALKSGRPVMLDRSSPAVKLPPELIEASFRGAAIPLTTAAEDDDTLVAALEASTTSWPPWTTPIRAPTSSSPRRLRDDASIANRPGPT